MVRRKAKFFMSLKSEQKRRRLVGPACLAVCLVISGGLLGRLWLHARSNRELVEAINRKDAPAVAHSLQQGADPNAHMPLPGSWLERLKRMLGGDADTPTVLVASLLGAENEGDHPDDHPEITRALLQYGADVHRKGWGWAPINAAASRGKTESVRLLLEKGADANAGQGTEFPALFYAAVTPEMAQLMLAHGANANMRDKGGKTPLHYAYLRQYSTSLALAQVLLEHGADVTLQDGHGDSPLSLVAQSQAAAPHPPDPWYRLFHRYAGKQRP